MKKSLCVTAGVVLTVALVAIGAWIGGPSVRSERTTEGMQEVTELSWPPEAEAKSSCTKCSKGLTQIMKNCQATCDAIVSTPSIPNFSKESCKLGCANYRAEVGIAGCLNKLIGD